jgi:diguanylate cyclase (GGDEF)-like protein
MIALKRRLVEAEARQREIAHRDSLTAVANRRAFDARLRKELDSRLEPSGGRRGTDSEPLALLLVDLDDFKSINDRHGHQIGDAVLRQTAERVHAVLRSTDMLARIGGDEFAVIAPGAHGEGAVGLAEAIRTAVAAAEPGSKVPLPRVSVGLATFPEDGIDYETLMASADRRLLRVKGNGTRPAARRGSESGLRLI